jgi:hypothetical protein
MNVVDSFSWIEYFSGGPNAKAFRNVIQDFNHLPVSIIIVYEVVRRMSLHSDMTQVFHNLTVMRRGRMVLVDEQIALDAVQLSVDYKLPMADSMHDYLPGHRITVTLHRFAWGC